MRRVLSGLAVAAIVMIAPASAAPRPIAELVLDVPFATAFVGEPIECTLRIRGPRIDEKIFSQQVGYTRTASPEKDDGFVYHFRFVPPTAGPHTIGPFAFEIDRFRLRSNSVEVVAYPKPNDAGAIRAIPSRAKIRLGETVAVRVEHGAQGPRPRLKPAAGYAVVGSSPAEGAITYVVKPGRTGTIVLSPEAFEGLTKTTPFWTVPIEVGPAVPAENPALPAPPRPGDEAKEAGVPAESL